LRADNSTPRIAPRQLSVGKRPSQMRADNSAQLKRVYEVYTKINITLLKWKLDLLIKWKLD